jgi:phosphoglycolate phosphatase
MSDFPFTLVGFDLDGTLLDTSGDLAAAVNHALGSAGRPSLPVEAIRPMIGGGSRHMLAQGMTATGGCTDAELDVLQARLLAYYEAHIAVETRPFPGCLDALDALAARGVTLAVVTNKNERLARLVLDSLGLGERFATIIGGDTLGPGRGKPAPDLIELMVERCGRGTEGVRAAFVGDSIYDVRAAQAAGLPVIACSFGFLQQPVGTLGADAVIDGYAELVATLETLGEQRA